MNHSIDPAAPKAAQIQMPEHFSSEPDLSHQWVTSMQPHWNGLVQVNDGHIRNLQTLIFNCEADKQMRIRALAQLRLYAIEDSSLEATAVLRQWEECGLKLE